MAADPSRNSTDELRHLRAQLVDLEAKLQKVLTQYEKLSADKRQSDQLLSAALASTSWRVTAPLRQLAAFRRQVTPLLRFRTIVPQIAPVQDITQTGNTLTVTGAKPILHLTFSDVEPPAGWTHLRLQYQGAADHSFFTLYVDRGQGFGEDPGRLVVLSAGANQILLDLPPGVRRMQIAPFDTSKVLTLTGVCFQEIGKLQLALDVARTQLAPLALKPSLAISKAGKALRVLREGGFQALRLRLFANQHTASYQEWLERYDTLTQEDLDAIRARLAKLAFKPKISIVMPVYNTAAEWLRAAIDSVLLQVYEHWELCIADDASPLPHVRPILEEYARRDPRIRVTFRDKNGHIAAASNSALELATGEFVALLDHDDELREHALAMVVEELNAHPESDLIYSDEDKKTGYGMRVNPYFKCDWNPELFLQQNFICHLGVYRTKVVQAAGGFRLGFEGSQDWDLALRVIERIPERNIRHIPHVLYHWRQIEGSTAASSSAKPYALLAGQKAVQEHLHRRGRPATVEILPEIAHYRIRYPLPTPVPRVTLIIPTRDQVEVLSQCVTSILQKTDYPNYEILIVDNGSSEEATRAYFASLAADARVRVLQDPRPFNFSRINNGAVQHCSSPYIAFINNDLEVISPDWLTEMMSHATHEEVGAVGARLWFPNDLLQHGGVILGIGGVAGHNHKGITRGNPGYWNRAVLTQNLSAVTAACLVMKREVFTAIGGFDEQNLAVAFNDVDLCLRIRESGRRLVWTPYAELYHHESMSRGAENTPAKFQRFEDESAYMRRRWQKELASDPAYNPNLTLVTEDFRFAFPPRAPRPWKQA